MESISSLLRKIKDSFDRMESIIEASDRWSEDHEVRYAFDEMKDKADHFDNLIESRMSRGASMVQPLRTRRDYGGEESKTVLPPIPKAEKKVEDESGEDEEDEEDEEESEGEVSENEEEETEVEVNIEVEVEQEGKREREASIAKRVARRLKSCE
jgi:hypothetical protein